LNLRQGMGGSENASRHASVSASSHQFNTDTSRSDCSAGSGGAATATRAAALQWSLEQSPLAVDLQPCKVQDAAHDVRQGAIVQS
jgi:hypothetical protein